MVDEHWRERSEWNAKNKARVAKAKGWGAACRVSAITIVKKRGRTVSPDIFSPGVNFPPIVIRDEWIETYFRKIFHDHRTTRWRYSESVITAPNLSLDILIPSFFFSRIIPRELLRAWGRTRTHASVRKIWHLIEENLGLLFISRFMLRRLTIRAIVRAAKGDACFFLVFQARGGKTRDIITGASEKDERWDV